MYVLIPNSKRKKKWDSGIGQNIKFRNLVKCL